jgi:FkbM family methyltransferase
VSLKHDVRRLLWKVGYDVVRFAPGSHPIARRRRLLSSLEIDVVLDVGANDGGWGHALRQELSYAGRICSFEPMKAAYRDLRARASRDPDWETYNFALGEADGRATINVAGNSYSSSILGMLPAHLSAAPESRFIAQEEIDVKTLDSIFADICRPHDNVYLKVDTQGFEGRVLRGARASLTIIDAVQLEMPLVPLYDGELSFADLYQLMMDQGYSLVALDPGFNDPRSGRLLQVDGIFSRLS